MFISRKKYEEALEAARKEGAEKVWEQQRNERYREDVCRRLEEVEKRLSHLEPKTVDTCQCNSCSGCSPLPY